MFGTKVISTVAALTVGLSLWSGGASAGQLSGNNGIAPMSPALAVIAQSADLTASTMKGNDFCFSEDYLKRGMNLSSVETVRIESLPAEETGTVTLGSTPLSAGDCVGKDSLKGLTVSLAEGADECGFTLSVNGTGVPVSCTVYALEQANAAPETDSVPTLSLHPTTYRNLPYGGFLTAHDPEGDELTYEIVDYPEKGTLTFTGDASGAYEYRPNDGYIGKDSFSYVARDRYGNYSAAATVELKVRTQTTSGDYVDLTGNNEKRVALDMTEAGIMSGSVMGGENYFRPDAKVTRAEFILMAMQCVGVADLPECEATSFADDAEIPRSMKDEIEAAYTLSYVDGKTRDGELCFLPNQTVTRGEAALIVCRMLGLKGVEGVEASTAGLGNPIWILSSGALESEGISGIRGNGDAEAEEGMSRIACAALFSQILEYKK